MKIQTVQRFVGVSVLLGSIAGCYSSEPVEQAAAARENTGEAVEASVVVVCPAGVALPPAPNLGVDKTAVVHGGSCPGVDPLIIPLGSQVDYCLTISNASSQPVHNLIVMDDNGAFNYVDLSYLLVTAGLADANNDGHADALNAGQSVTVQYGPILFSDPDGELVTTDLVRVGFTFKVGSSSECVAYYTDMASVINGPVCVQQPATCNDSNACTTDACDPVTGCTHAPVSCNDGNACTADVCDPATGCGHVAVSCNDSNACTADSCDPATGCGHTAVSCNDGNACTADSCDPATGCGHAAISCDDANACTADACDPATGCGHAAVSCDDGNACTADACDPVTGCGHAAVSCDDANACTADSCDAVTGCASTPISCDDGNACTADSCDAITGCGHTAVSCDDGNACTADSCDAITGCGHTAISCDDGNACSADSCDAITGCGHTAVSCDDANACTTDSCDAVTGCGHTAVSCNDGNACTSDTCDAITGCAHDAISCDDGNACTADSCNTATGCRYVGISCDDGNPCTADSCDPSGGCSHTPVACGTLATRTVGFYANHPEVVASCLSAKGGVIDLGFVQLRNEIADNEIDVDIDHRVETGLLLSLGMLKANIAKYRNGTHRSALAKARMQAGQQMVAALCNNALTGANPSFNLNAAVATLAGTDVAAILAINTQADAFNNSNDSAPLGVSFGSANSKAEWDDPTDPND